MESLEHDRETEEFILLRYQRILAAHSLPPKVAHVAQQSAFDQHVLPKLELALTLMTNCSAV